MDLSLLPDDSHVCLAKEVDKPLLRRSYSYSDGIDEKTGQFDTGLLFISFQKDPDNFVKVQTNLGATDKMNEYITHIGSGLFTCFGGVEKGGYIGQKLLEKVREAFKKMNSTWTINESVVRDNSIAHYGRVETAISFLPSSMEIEPTDESGT